MRALFHSSVTWALLVAATACSADSSPPTGNIEVTIAPLDLPGVANAAYTVEVQNQAGQTVWIRAIDADRYGDGQGSVSYVGACDADSPAHSVRLTIDALCDGLGFPFVAAPSPTSRRLATRPGRSSPGTSP